MDNSDGNVIHTQHLNVFLNERLHKLLHFYNGKNGFLSKKIGRFYRQIWRLGDIWKKTKNREISRQIGRYGVSALDLYTQQTGSSVDLKDATNVVLTNGYLSTSF